jgi:hypothetical protein
MFRHPFNTIYNNKILVYSPITLINKLCSACYWYYSQIYQSCYTALF